MTIKEGKEETVQPQYDLWITYQGVNVNDDIQENAANGRKTNDNEKSDEPDKIGVLWKVGELKGKANSISA
jgi:hypothetical protein